MDITWSAIGKLLLAGLGTYVLLPAILILRDYILWKLVNTFILNEKLRRKVKSLAIFMQLWNENYAKDVKINSENNKTTYFVGGEELTSEEFKSYREKEDKLKSQIEEAQLYIKRKSNFLNWLLKHYKQDATNPINDWLQYDTDRLNKNNVESNS